MEGSVDRNESHPSDIVDIDYTLSDWELTNKVTTYCYPAERGTFVTCQETIFS